MKSNVIERPTPSDKDLADQTPFRMTHRQAASLIASTILGVGVLTLPRSTAVLSQQNGWISCMLGALLSMVALSIITTLSRRHYGESIIQYAVKLLSPKNYPVIGMIVGFPLFLAYVVYWLGSTSMVARTFGEVVTATVLTRTPLEVIIGTMLITAYILVVNDIEVVVRVNEVLIPLIVIPVVIIGLSSLQSAKLDNLLPLFQISFYDFMKGVLITSGSYLGFEVMTIFGASSESTGTPFKHQAVGIAVPGLIYSLIVFSGIAVFGVDELKLLAWPTLELVKTTEVPGLILERLESAFLGVWVAAVFTTLGNLYFALALTLKEILHMKSHRLIALLLLPVFYWTSMKPPNVQSLFEWSDLVNYVGLLCAFAIPALLLILSFMRKSIAAESQRKAAENQKTPKPKEPSQGEQPQGEQSQGEQSQGEQSQGEQSQGEQSQGEQPQGEQSQGEQSQGEQPQGEQSQSEQSQGEQSQGEQSQGEQPQGEQSQGEQPQGEQPQGEQSQGEQPQGEQPQGEQSQGEQSQSEQSQDERPRS
ncbi:GerAB/ArcD/ProY family transporter [Paenibacillus sp. N4]|uniref:GerAB/ArcD/ProY family transporter n=1 Tax=Paenibacillus vietnamensis TaxID=2590547 RepID=UPI001CD1081B|nr:GerAB/ArcD/ProY family transporter [Paenibacillus vietnamensis]MCA0755407.1 GerAB/ArcD/ProY family transporter [Paenibacillus vietnamensis]